MASSDQRWTWFVVSRWQAFDGESRANVLRVVAIVCFYGVQLADYYYFAQLTADIRFHQLATAVTVAWICVSLGITLCLQRRIFPALLPFLLTAADIALLTAIAAAGSGAQSPLTRVYFLILALAALRFNALLIWFATLGCIVGYLCLVGRSDPKWFDAVHATPVVEQLVMLLSLTLVGILLGQIVRRAHALASEYARRLSIEGPRR